MRKIQSKHLILSVIIFTILILVGSIIFIVGMKQINRRTPLEEGKQYMEDLLSDKVPSEIILHYGNSEVPVKDKGDIKAITEMLYPMVVVEEEKDERLQECFVSMDLVYKGQTRTVAFTVQGLAVNDKVYVPQESETPLVALCRKITYAEMQKYLDGKDDLIHMADLFPEETFKEVRYYYMGEPISVTDTEIINVANRIFMDFYGEEVVLEEEYIGGYSLDFVYQQEVVAIFFQGNRVGIGEKIYWIREDVSPFIDLISEAAVAIYEKQQ